MDNEGKSPAWEGISFSDILFTGKKYLRYIVIITVLCTLCGFAVSYFFIAPKYSSSARLLVNVRQSTSSSITNDQLTTAENLANTYAVILESDTAMEAVKDSLNLNLSADAIKKMISITSVDQTQVFDISVTYTDPDVAANVANALTDVAPEIISNTIDAGTVKTIAAAKVNRTPVSPNVPLITLGALAGGFVVSLAAFLLKERLDTTFTSTDDIQKYLGLPLLGVIPSTRK